MRYWRRMLISECFYKYEISMEILIKWFCLKKETRMAVHLYDLNQILNSSMNFSCKPVKWCAALILLRLFAHLIQPNISKMAQTKILKVSGDDDYFRIFKNWIKMFLWILEIGTKVVSSIWSTVYFKRNTCIFGNNFFKNLKSIQAKFHIFLHQKVPKEHEQICYVFWILIKV